MVKGMVAWRVLGCSALFSDMALQRFTWADLSGNLIKLCRGKATWCGSE